MTPISDVFSTPKSPASRGFFLFGPFIAQVVNHEQIQQNRDRHPHMGCLKGPSYWCDTDFSGNDNQSSSFWL
jgi:hypothetical protein